MINEIKKELLNVQDKKYKDFSSSLLPGVNNVIGVRIPFLRKMAKEILKSDYKTFLKENDDEYMELTLLEGMLIGSLKIDFSEYLKLIENYVPKITNWSICDCFCCNLKMVKTHKKETKQFLKKYSDSDKEFELRFYYVMLLDYFIESDYKFVINEIIKFNNEAYYAKMAAAWCLSICIIKNFNLCLDDIKTEKIHPWVLKKGIQKAIESFRLKKEQKALLRNLIC